MTDRPRSAAAIGRGWVAALARYETAACATMAGSLTVKVDP